MLRWTRSMEKAMSVYNIENVEALWKVDADSGKIILGKESMKHACVWVMLCLKPQDVFQLEMLNVWLENYHNTLDYFAPYAYKFRWSVAPLRNLQASLRSKGNEKWFWTGACEIAWLSLQYSVHTEWSAGQEYLLRTKFLNDMDDGSYDASDHDYEDCLTRAFWDEF